MALTAVKLEGGSTKPVNVPQSAASTVAKSALTQSQQRAKEEAARIQREQAERAARISKQAPTAKSTGQRDTSTTTTTATTKAEGPDNDGVDSPGTDSGGGKNSDGVVCSFGGMNFGRTGSILRAVSDLKIVADTQQKTGEKEKVCYVQRECAKPTKVTATITLHVEMGCNVQSDCVTLRSWAESGKSDYFYLNGSKLFDYKLMLTKAEVTYLRFYPHSGRPMSAQVRLTWERGDASGTSDGAGSAEKKGSGSGYDTTTATEVKRTTGGGSTTATEEKKTGMDAIDRWREAIQRKQNVYNRAI